MSVFQFKQFTLAQVDGVFKVGTDGCLLGAWVNVEGKQQVLDVGTGTGLIALMIAQRCQAEITAIDIDAQSAMIALKNAVGSPWNERVHVKRSSLNELAETSKFDLIVCNPPFFKSSTLSGNLKKDRARHETHLNLDVLFEKSMDLITKDGHLALIVPIDRWTALVETAQLHGWHLENELRIRPTLDKPCNRVLSTWSPNSNRGIESLEWTLYDPHPEYTAEVRDILSPFYLNL